MRKRIIILSIAIGIVAMIMVWQGYDVTVSKSEVRSFNAVEHPLIFTQSDSMAFLSEETVPSANIIFLESDDIPL